MDSTTFENIEKAIEEIRPFLLSDGGDVEIMGYEDNILRVKLLGACETCSINETTIKLGIEAAVKKYAPEVKKVEHV